MRVLLIHNFYGSAAPSGENTVFKAERELLRSAGHEILEYTRHSDEIRNRGKLGTVQGGILTPWNPFAFRDIRRLLRQHDPQVMHVHNTFPLISPAIFHAARRRNTATLLTLHNYRIFCPAGIPLREGKPCIECLVRRNPIPALKYGCYRGQRLATLPLAAMSALHRRLKTWERNVDGFIALSSFQQRLMAESGLPPDRIHIKPQFYPDPPDALPWARRKAKIIYIGRLSREKGVDTLLDAWRGWGEDAPLLEIVGDGDRRTGLENRAADLPHPEKIRFLGPVPFEQTQKLLARARLLVLPSLCYEGFPMVIREAFALGVPVAASKLGPLPGIVKDGYGGALFPPGNANALGTTLRKLWRNEERLSAMARNARSEFEEKYTAAVNYEQLMAIYVAAIRHRKNRDA
jgi:glycosyltransferase involved in cell wall biosynthesis